MPRRNKYLIFSFIVLFALSGTGLPLIVHLCRTMDEVSFKSCGMCGSHKVTDGSVLSRTDDCCNTAQVSASITDQYIITKSDQDTQSFVVAVLPFISQSEEPEISYSTNYSGNSPPEKSDVPLFIINSSFLI